MKFFTKTLSSGTLSIDAADGAYSVSIQANDSSSANITGGIPFRGESPAAVLIDSGQALTITSNNLASPLDGLVITWVSGTVDIIIGF